MIPGCGTGLEWNDNCPAIAVIMVIKILLDFVYAVHQINMM